MPFVAALTAAAPLLSKIGASGAGKKGLGIAVRAISNVKNKATDILQRKKSKAELKAEEAKARAAQFAALAGGTAYSSVKPESAAEKVTFGEKMKKPLGIFKEEKSKTETMEKAKEFFTKNWMYVVGGLVLLMFLKKRR
jgi:hypothetical protein